MTNEKTHTLNLSRGKTSNKINIAIKASADMTAEPMESGMTLRVMPERSTTIRIVNRHK